MNTDRDFDYWLFDTCTLSSAVSTVWDFKKVVSRGLGSIFFTFDLFTFGPKSCVNKDRCSHITGLKPGWRYQQCGAGAGSWEFGQTESETSVLWDDRQCAGILWNMDWWGFATHSSQSERSLLSMESAFLRGGLSGPHHYCAAAVLTLASVRWTWTWVVVQQIVAADGKKSKIYSWRWSKNCCLRKFFSFPPDFVCDTIFICTMIVEIFSSLDLHISAFMLANS